MKSSLSLRLLMTAAISTLVALIATALALNFLFRAYFEDRIQLELESYLTQLTANVSLNAAGDVEVSELADPRFSAPLSGYYWQVQLQDQQPMLSQSFWAEPLDLPRPERRGEIVFSSVDGTANDSFLAGYWVVTLEYDGANKEVLLIVAVDQAEFNDSVTGFSRNVAISMVILGAFLVLASWLQVRIGLSPLEKVRSEVSGVKRRHGTRLSNDYPSEVEPLVDEVNDLLERQERTIDEARARASNLAHGLKTPLTIMQALSEELKRTDQPDVSAEIDAQIDNMQHFVERELARTRDQTSEALWCKPAPVVERLVLAFQRRTGANDTKWNVDMDGDAVCPLDEYALTELLGNLVDNASKWTKDEILITVRGTREAGYIAVADNGPGISDNNFDAALRRGNRLDDAVPGQGLGLAIVSDMAQKRGAVFDLSNRESGGLIAKVSWGESDNASVLG